MPFISGIGPLELVIILVIALIVVGPGRLPDVGSALGKSIREFRKAATDVKEATSLEAATPSSTTPPVAPAPASAHTPSAAAAPVVPPPPPDALAHVSAPDGASETVTTIAPASAGDAPDIAPDVADLPEPLPVPDEQPTRTV
jgi:TatA/E family protein of Tat protein translocase